MEKLNTENLMQMSAEQLFSAANPADLAYWREISAENVERLADECRANISYLIDYGGVIEPCELRDIIADSIASYCRTVSAVADELRRIRRSYELKARIVNAGNSAIFSEWEKEAGITKDEFLDALRWLCDDPLDPHGRVTRGLGCERTGKYRGLHRINYVHGAEITTLYDDRGLWINTPDNARICAKDRI